MKKILAISAVVITAGVITYDIINSNKATRTNTNIQSNVDAANVNTATTPNIPVVNPNNVNQVPQAVVNNQEPQSIINNQPLIGPHKVPANTVVFNNNIASPDGTNKFPAIVPPGINVAPSRIGPPPEAGFMRQCQINARGNPEAMRKCFEARISANITPLSGNATANANNYLIQANQKTAYCKKKSGNDQVAFNFCMTTEEVKINNQPASAEFMQAIQNPNGTVATQTTAPVATQQRVTTTNQAKPNNPYSSSIFK